jgi:uncharacterized protein with von Willebrand factor type A (vWA) domain
MSGRGGLLDRELDFVVALRRAGLAVGTAETLDATRVFGAVDILDRAGLLAGLAAALCKRPAHRRTFDTLFDLYFPARQGEPSAQPGDPQPGEPAADPGLLRDMLRDLLLEGDPDALARFAALVVGLLGRAGSGPGRQTFFAYRVLRALAPDTLMASLLNAMLAGSQRGGLAETVARATISERLRQFEQAVEAEVRRRLAEERGIDQVARTALHPLTEQVDFLRATRDELAQLRRTVGPLARRLATRLAARRRMGREGRLDFRRTVRASLGTGGVPLVTHHRPKKTHKPELVVLCDVSASVAAFANFTLLLTSALREQFSRVRAFAFIDTCDEITRFFDPGSDLVTAMTRVVREAELVCFDGHSDYGHSFEVFLDRYPDAVGPRTSLLVLGDGRNNYRATGAPALALLCARARHSYWLNPEPRSYWATGDSAALMYEPLVDDMVECRNVEQLAEFVSRLLPA